MKKYLSLFLISLLTFGLFAQSDDDLFGSDDDLFGDDGIEVVESVIAKSDLSKGTLFEAGAVKVGGKLDSSISSSTVLYRDDDSEFSDNVKNTTLEPALNTFLTVDARPTDILRIYTKFGFNYPFTDTASAYEPYGQMPTYVVDANGNMGIGTPVTIDLNNWFTVQELFTDFSAKDRIFFRFGIHTVTWGTGYFFSPVSDIINASSINPEDTDAQVAGVLNLRTQITFPDSQNCLWTYVVPSATKKAQDTGLAAKYEFVIKGWEFGLGGYYQYQNAPKAILTASGSLKKCTIFGEFVYQYGGASEWAANTDWDDKKSIIQATAGVSYMFKDPQITVAGQYYYDGNDKDMKHEYFTFGHNVAGMVNFGKLFGSTDWNLALFGMANFGKEDIPAMYKTMIDYMGYGSFINTATFSGTLSYKPFANCSIGCGPYVTMTAWDEKPAVSGKLTFKLGGGKF